MFLPEIRQTRRQATSTVNSPAVLDLQGARLQELRMSNFRLCVIAISMKQLIITNKYTTQANNLNL